MSVKNGGPALPIETQVIERGEGLRPWTIEGSRGISAHDYFAAKAMQGLLAGCIYNPGQADQLAKDSKAIADAMIAAREIK